jgi:hypothetical protein
MPMNWATLALSKYIPPRPSDPASMPTIKKKMRVGTPNLRIVFPAIMLINNNIDPINSIFPVSITIGPHYVGRKLNQTAVIELFGN